MIVRGLPFVRSELNGRDIFSATGGTVLSFNDVSPELLGRVEVFKNLTADMVEGGIAGTVNLVTRKPLDRPGTHLAGTIEGNYGDLAKEWSPGFSLTGSTTWESNIGTVGLQLGYARSELVSRTDASQVGDPCYRAATLNGACFRVVPVGSGGFGGTTNFTAANFPPAGAVVVPKGAGVRTTDLERDREAFSGVLQYETPARDLILTFECSGPRPASSPTRRQRSRSSMMTPCSPSPPPGAPGSSTATASSSEASSASASAMPMPTPSAAAASRSNCCASSAPPTR